MARLFVFVAIGFLASPLVTRAQIRSQEGRVTIYPEPNYRGEPLVLEVGASVENLAYARDNRGRPWNDQAASVRIEGPVVLIAYEQANFRGAQTTITRNSADLATLSLGDRRGLTWEKRISSVRAEPVASTGPVFLQWERRDAERAVRSAYRDILGRDPDEDGLRQYRTRLMERGWNEDQLRDNLRSSPEFRARDVEAVVRKIYRDVLNRDPDPSGLATYTRRLQGGMSEAELRAELKRSGEHGDAAVRESVTRVYREVLRRDPDAEGLANYTKMIKERGWDENRVRDALRKSDEFRNLRK
ncbi:MAG: hypothetical protein JWM32_1613 [Verrucomicrobia bacterium]|nr:hypothetical protein [Verrucomicrobiota bacterium]